MPTANMLDTVRSLQSDTLFLLIKVSDSIVSDPEAFADLR